MYLSWSNVVCFINFQSRCRPRLVAEFIARKLTRNFHNTDLSILECPFGMDWTWRQVVLGPQGLLGHGLESQCQLVLQPQHPIGIDWTRSTWPIDNLYKVHNVYLGMDCTRSTSPSASWYSGYPSGRLLATCCTNMAILCTVLSGFRRPDGSCKEGQMC